MMYSFYSIVDTPDENVAELIMLRVFVIALKSN